MKPAGFLTNSVFVADAVNVLRTKYHGHIRLEGGRAKEAQVHLVQRCKAICRGIVMQQHADVAGSCVVVDSRSLNSMGNAQSSSNGFHEDDAWLEAWDDVTGNELNPELVEVARKEEVKQFKKMGLHEGANTRCHKCPW